MRGSVCLAALMPLVAAGPAGAAAVVWPVDVHGAATLRGAFGDMRGVGYHYGVDIAVDDAHPARGAPRGLSQRVRAVRAGYAAYTGIPDPCIQRRIRVGSILYLHVSPTVPAGRRVAIGDPIGWTCEGNWHIHISQAAHPHVHDGDWLNPLGPGGLFAGFRDWVPPKVGPLVFVEPSVARVIEPPMYGPKTTARYAAAGSPVERNALSGVIDVVARLTSAWPAGRLSRREPWTTTRGLPYRARIVVRDEHGRVVYRNVPFVADLMGAPTGVHLPADPSTLFASGTQAPAAPASCRLILHRGGRCPRGVYWIHMTARRGEVGLDTRSLRNGRYTVIVEAWNASGVHASTRRKIRVRNERGARYGHS